MAKSVNKLELREGFTQPIDLNNIFGKNMPGIV